MFGCGMLVMSIMHIWREDMAVNICDTTYIYENYERMVLPEDVAIQFPRYDVYRYASRRPSHQKGALDSIVVEFVHSLVGRKKIFVHLMMSININLCTDSRVCVCVA